MYKETETLELKKSLSQLREGIISLSAMLNKCGKGKVIFGINDDGKVFGLTIGKRTKADIAHEIQNNLKPLPLKINIDELAEDEKNIITIYVEGNDTPYSAYGRYYIRLDDADILMHPQELEHFFETKKETYSLWEQEETSFTVDDINEDQLIDCVRAANEKGRLNYVYRNATEALAKFGLLTENGYLNNAGLFLFGKNKPVTIKEANFPTDSRTEFGEIKEFKGNILECIQESVSYIQNHISYKSNIIGLKREETPEIPLKAIREIVINSFAHCSYAKTGDYNSYTIFKSQIKIYNPGPIIKNIDPLKFASGSIGSKIRNVLISKVLFMCGYIDAFGTGFDRTFTLCANDNISYKYHNDEFGFTFIFERNVNFLNDTINDTINDTLNTLDQGLINHIKENKYITILELSKLTDKSTPTVQRHLNCLTEKGIIRRVGSRKAGYWKII